MNVTCDKCHKRYAIADEKVRGKSMVKIRCKQCQNLIAVQGLPALDGGAPAGPPAAAPPLPKPAAAPAMPQLSAAPALGDEDTDERTRAMPAMDLAQNWFAMVNKVQVGPFNVRQLEAKVKAGEVTLRTYLWKQGMEGWKRASDVPELSPILAGVSVGATATGPTTSASRPTSSPRLSQAQRDVALANEVPMPEVTARPQPAPAVEPAPQPRSKPVAVSLLDDAPLPDSVQEQQAEQPQQDDPHTDEAQLPSNQPVGEEPAFAQQGGGLANLFDGIGDAPSNDMAQGGPSTDAAQPGEVGGDSGGVPLGGDPFAALGPVDPKELPPPGEATKFFIAQAGVNKRNPWWKIALFVGGAPVLLIGVAFLLSSLRIIPPVTRTTEDGREVQESFFSAGGVSGLKDILSGEEKRRKQVAAAKRAAEEEAERQRKAAIAARGKGDGAEQKERERPDQALLKKEGDSPRVSADQLAALYGDTSKGNVGPRVKGEARPAADSTQGGLDNAAAAKVVGGSQQAFQGCIEEALKRNPNLKVGKITLTVHVGSSGTVIRTEIEPKVNEGSDWGRCLRDRAKRMVFPAFSGDEEAAVQIPLVVGLSVQ